MNYFLSLILSLSLVPNEINVANSVDWLCYESTTIATVKVDSYHEQAINLRTQTSDCYVKVTITHQYKGQEPMLNNVIIYSRLTYIGYDKWKNMEGKEVMVFLKDLGCDKLCSYTIFDDDYGMMDINSPAPKALSGDFKMIMKKDSLIGYVIDRIKKLEGKTAKPYYLEVPYETEAFGALYGGSSCYLIVPDVLYPKAKKGMN